MRDLYGFFPSKNLKKEREIQFLSDVYAIFFQKFKKSYNKKLISGSLLQMPTQRRSNRLRRSQSETGNILHVSV
jgi:hypothetical protein